MILSTLAFSLMNAFVKYLLHFDANELVFFRSLGSLILTMTYLVYYKIPLLGNKRGLLVLRGLCGVTSMTLFFMSLKYLTLGSAVSLRYIAPIFAAVFAVFLLKEKIKMIQWVFFAIAFSGVLTLKGYDSEVSSLGMFLVLGASAFSGLVFILINKIGKRDHPVVIVNYFMAIATLVGGVLSINNWITPTGGEWLSLIGLGFFGFFGQLFMTKAFQIASTNQVAPIKYVEVIFTVLLGIFWFGEIYTLWSILGIFLIITGLILNVLFKPKSA